MSETDFLKLKKHDNVETNIEKFDIKNYLNGNWDKIDKNVGEVNTDISNINSKNKEQDTNIKQLQENTETSSNKIAELEKELKEAQEDFYQNSIRGQASGEYIHVEDSSNCRSIIGISGNSEQEMRSGKNYLNTLAKYKAGEKVTVDGITYIFNEDGSITCNGTATADSVLTFSSNLQTINGSGKKIVGMITGTQVPAKLSILAYTSDWSKNTFELLSSVNKNITINMQENIDYTIFRIIAYKGTTLNNQTIYYQILDTSVNDLTYEQYGASPSPDYQSEVKSVGSNVNIFDKDNPDMFLNRLTPDNSGNIVSTLTDTTKTNYIITIIVPCKGNKQYTISRWLSGKTFIVYESEKNKFNINDKVTLLKRNDNSGIINETIATSANAKYILVKIYSTWGNEENTYNDLISSIKIEKGKVATSYSKYGQGCVKVTKCNKNIFKPEEFSIINQNVTCSYKDGKFTLNGEVTSAFTIDISKHFDFNKIAQLTVNKNVTFSIQKYTGNIDFELNLGSRSSFYILQLRSLKKTKITKNLLEELTRFSLYVGVGKYNNFSFELQLEIGDNQTVSVGPAEQSYIMPTQKEMLQGDYFDFDNEEEVHTKAKLVLTGNENWKLESTGRFGIIKSDLPEIPAATSNNNYLGNMCNSYKESTPALTWKKVQGFCVDMSSCLRIYDDKYSTNNDLEGFKTYLKSQYDAGTPVIIYYKLQTPTRLAFTDEQKAVAKELTNARTYKNVTNITTDSKAILSLDYAKDQETQNQKMQNEIDEIKQLLSTTQTSALLLDNMQTDIESEVK